MNIAVIINSSEPLFDIRMYSFNVRQVRKLPILKPASGEKQELSTNRPEGVVGL